MAQSEKRALLDVSTIGLPRREQFAAFREAICPVYAGVVPELIADECGFDARFTAMDLGASKVARLMAPGHAARCGASGVNRTLDDNVFINFSEDSDYIASDDLGPSSVRHRSPRLHGNEKAGILRFPERRMTLHSLRLPRQALGRDLSLKRLNMALSATALGRLVGAQFQLLCQAMRLENPVAIASTARSVENLLVALADQTRSVDGVPIEPRAATGHMKNYALARLGDRDLSVAAVAAAFHCTSRTVQNYFAADGETFSAWLMEQRLVRAHVILCNPSQGSRSVESIGHACGFVSAAHFHRAFKARFGATPGTLRCSRFSPAL